MRITVSMDFGEEMSLADFGGVFESWLDREDSDTFTITPFLNLDADCVELTISKIETKEIAHEVV